MAITPSIQTDITANGLYVGAKANKTAYSASNLLNSGYVVDASAKGIYSPRAGSVEFPVWDWTTAVTAALPSNGSATGNSYAATHKYVNVPCVNKIVSVAYQEQAILTGIGGMEEYLTEFAAHVGNRQAEAIEKELCDKGVAGDLSKITTYAAQDPSFARISAAAITAFGSKIKWDNLAFVVNKEIYSKLIQDTNYVAASHSSKTDLAGKPIETYNGMALIVSDYIVADGTTATASNCLLVEKGGLQVFMNGDVRLKTSHTAASDTEVLDAIFSFCVHKTEGSPNPVRVVQFKTA